MRIPVKSLTPVFLPAAAAIFPDLLSQRPSQHTRHRHQVDQVSLLFRSSFFQGGSPLTHFRANCYIRHSAAWCMMPAGMQHFMEPLDEQNVLSALRDADRVGFCTENCLQRMAKKVVTQARAPKALVHPGSMVAGGGARCCPGGCGGQRVLFGNSKVDAVVLGVDGLHKATHVPLRCQRGVCPLSGKRVWHSFVTDDKQHLRNFPDAALPKIVMLRSTFVVTRAWHRQFILRVLK